MILKSFHLLEGGLMNNMGRIHSSLAGCSTFLILTIILLFISSTATLALAQANQYQSLKGVKFKDGSVIMGTVTQLNVETVTIRLNNGQTVVRKFDDVDTFIKRDDAVKTYQEAKPAASPAAVAVPAAVPPAAPPTTAPTALPAGPAAVTEATSTPPLSGDAHAVQISTPQVATDSPVVAAPIISAYRRGYFALGGGSGGDAESSNGRMEAGAYTVNHSLNYLIGFGLTVTFERDDTPSGLLDYPVPHSSYRNLGERNYGEEWGFYAKLGFEPINGSGLFIFGLGGFTIGQSMILAQSLATGWYYTQSTDTNFYGLIGGGIGYFGASVPISLQISYDNRMGTTGMLGFSW